MKQIKLGLDSGVDGVVSVMRAVEEVVVVVVVVAAVY